VTATAQTEVLYPEHEKMAAVKVQSQALGAFLEWLENEGGIVLAMRDPERHGELLETFESTETLLARYFEIDLKKISAEKEAMFEAQRARVAPRGYQVEAVRSLLHDEVPLVDGKPREVPCPVCTTVTFNRSPGQLFVGGPAGSGFFEPCGNCQGTGKVRAR
jgi:hypothetical protein